jgi:hypothetical protein
MGPSATLKRFPTFVAWYRGLVRLTRAMARAGVWLTPRVATALVLLMSLELVWVAVMPGQTDRVMVPAAMTQQTTVGFFHQSPPPWPQGNCFNISSSPRWLGALLGSRRTDRKVCNMHVENFSAIVGRLKLKVVEIEPVDERSCLITDRRIPREWLLQQPCPTCYHEPDRRDLLRRYPEHFSAPPSP